MGRRGRHPDPNSKRSQAALARAAALGKAAAAPPPKPVKKSKTAPPADVKARPLAAAFWAAHAGPLVAAGRLRPEHAAAMALLAHLHADCHELREQVAAEGRITATGKGQGVSPAARLLREARADFLTACREFGLTPASETRFPAEAVHDGEAEDPDRAALRAFGLTG
jgi:phage terminase small subunit